MSFLMKHIVVVNLCLVSCALAQTGPPPWSGVQFNGGASLTTQPLTETFTAGAGGVAANTLVTTDSSSPAKIISATGNTVYGVAMGTAAAGATVEVARYGQVPCFVDAGGAVQGDLAIVGTGNVTYCKDSGQTLPANIPIGTRIIGQFRTAAPAGSTALIELTPYQFGLQTGEAFSLNGAPEGSFGSVNLLPSPGLNWQLTPNLQTLNITPQLDSAVVPSKMAANTFAAGSKQTMVPSATTAGLNIAGGPLPTQPAAGDLAVDSTGNLRWYDGLAWRLGTVADTMLTAGAPVFGNGTNHITTGSTTGTGSVVLATTPTLINPLISSFVNALHDHSSPSNGGGLSVNAFNNGLNASSATFLRGDGTWALPPSPVSSVFGRSGTVTAQTGDYNFSQIAGTAALNQLPGSGAITVAGQSCSLGSSCTLASANLSDASNLALLNANQTITGNRTYTGTVDNSSGAHTLPLKAGIAANAPGTCTPGEMYFATDLTAGQNLLYCAAANTWTAQAAGTTNQTIRELSLEFSGGGTPLSTPMTDCRWVDYTGTIYKVTLNSDIAGSATIQVAAVSYASYTGFGSFSTYYGNNPIGSEGFANAYKAQDTTLTGWTTSLPTPAFLCAQLQSPATFTVAHMVIDVLAN